MATTLSPVTTTPVSAMLSVHPTPLPWSARHAQMSSRIVLSRPTMRLVTALPTCGPPIRKNTSCSAPGSFASLEPP